MAFQLQKMLSRAVIFPLQNGQGRLRFAWLQKLAWIFGFCLSTSLHSQPITQASTAKPSLKQAKSWFEKQNCRQVIRILTEKDFTKDLESESEFIDRYHMLGVCYFRVGDKKNAEVELNELLFIRPDFELDPFATPPPLLDIFNELKNKIAAKSKELKLAKEKAIDKPEAAEKKLIYRQHSLIPAFAPFGLGQFERGEVTKGIIFATTQASMLSANIGFYWWKRSLSDSQGTSANIEQYNLAQTLQFISLGAFLGIYIYSVTDGVLNHKPETEEIASPSTVDLTTEAFFEEFKKAKNGNS